MKVALAIAGTLVIAVLMAMPVSSAGGVKSGSMYVIDREGDLGKIFYTTGYGSHLFADPLSWWSGESPISDAGYLDMVLGWIVIDHKTLNLGMQVSSPLSEETALPEGFKAVQWSWFFTSTPTEWRWDYEILIFWDGLGFSAFQVDRRTTTFTVTPLDSFEVSGDTLTVTVDAAILENQVAWFFETTAYEKPPGPVTGYRTMGGWGSPDCPDNVGQTPEAWPNMPLPGL